MVYTNTVLLWKLQRHFGVINSPVPSTYDCYFIFGRRRNGAEDAVQQSEPEQLSEQSESEQAE